MRLTILSLHALATCDLRLVLPKHGDLLTTGENLTFSSVDEVESTTHHIAVFEKMRLHNNAMKGQELPLLASWSRNLSASLTAPGSS
jgi:hypothetical protein